MGGGNKIALEPDFEADKFNGQDGVGSGSEVREEESFTHIPLSLVLMNHPVATSKSSQPLSPTHP